MCIYRWLTKATEVLLPTLILGSFYKTIRMNNKDYWVYSGCIASGPSREAMFDSLRLGNSVIIGFVFTNKEVYDREAVIIGISKKNIHSKGYCSEWIIQVVFEEKYNSKKMLIPWEGNYSTRKRQGQIIGKLPKCLIK